jgi:hypothetical protein
MMASAETGRAHPGKAASTASHTHVQFIRTTWDMTHHYCGNPDTLSIPPKNGAIILYNSDRIYLK